MPRANVLPQPRERSSPRDRVYRELSSPRDRIFREPSSPRGRVFGEPSSPRDRIVREPSIARTPADGQPPFHRTRQEERQHWRAYSRHIPRRSHMLSPEQTRLHQPVWSPQFIQRLRRITERCQSPIRHTAESVELQRAAQLNTALLALQVALQALSMAVK